MTTETRASETCPCLRCTRLRRRTLINGRLVATDAPAHGSASTYGNWGCRCRECTTAASARSAMYVRKRAQRRKERQAWR